VITDKERIQKSLKTSHPPGPPVVLRKFESPQDEAAYIAYEIKRTIAYSGNTLDFNDFSVLVRYNALTRNIEAALQGAGIQSRMIGGHKFFDRAEVKDILAYLQLADNPSYTRRLGL
jgi:DNA helicase-2/ATP-dependent DNA helicase PcrA